MAPPSTLAAESQEQVRQRKAPVFVVPQPLQRTAEDVTEAAPSPPSVSDPPAMPTRSLWSIFQERSSWRQHGWPGRPLNWRWKLALLLLDSDPCSIWHSQADDSVRHASAFGALLRTHGSTAHAQIRERFPDMAEAHDLVLEFPAYRRWAIEARLLAGESPEVIGVKCGVRSGAIVAYEKCFFQFQDRRDNRSFIHQRVIRDCGPLNFGDALGTYWRRGGYAGGLFELEGMLATAMRFLPPSSLPATAVVSEERMVSWQTHLANWLLPIRPETEAYFQSRMAPSEPEPPKSRFESDKQELAELRALLRSLARKDKYLANCDAMRVVMGGASNDKPARRTRRTGGRRSRKVATADTNQA